MFFLYFGPLVGCDFTFYDRLFLSRDEHEPKHNIEKIEKYSTLELVDSFVERISSSRCFMYWKSKISFRKTVDNNLKHRTIDN